jgi:hypothetical protein
MAAIFVIGIVDWAVRIVVPFAVIHSYGWLAGIGVGIVLVAVSEIVYRLFFGEWGNLWPTRAIIALAARRRAKA